MEFDMRLDNTACDLAISSGKYFAFQKAFPQVISPS